MRKVISSSDFSAGSDLEMLAAVDVPSPNDKNDEGKAAVQALVKRDDNNVKLWRILVLGLILLAGAGVSTITYRVLKKEEHDDYETSVSFRRSGESKKAKDEIEVVELFL